MAIARDRNTVPREMLEREIDRARERDRAQDAPMRREPHPVLALQRAIGNRAVAQVLARAPAVHDTVQIHGLGSINVTGGNLEAWTGADTPQTVDVTSHKGRHSAKLEKLSHDRTPVEAKVTIAPPNKGTELTTGSTVLDIKGAEVEHYAVADGTETWRLGGSMSVHRTKITHHLS
jgi:hypothetical protein